jgi:hypothetical protein
LFIYEFFVRGVTTTGPDVAVQAALVRVFLPIWKTLAMLFISHGVSFADNFIAGREYTRTSVQALMAAPYNRIIVMQLALIFGGWIILLVHSPVPALVLLVIMKTALDFRAHREEHRPDRHALNRRRR